MGKTWVEKWQKKSNFKKQEYRLHNSLVYFRHFKDSHLWSMRSPSFSQEYINLRQKFDFLYLLQFMIGKIKVAIESNLTSYSIQKTLKHDLETLKTNYFSLQIVKQQGRRSHQCMYRCMYRDLCQKEDFFETMNFDFVGDAENNGELIELKSYMISFKIRYQLYFKCKLKTEEKYRYEERMKFQILKKGFINQLKSNYNFSEKQIRSLSKFDYRDDYDFITGELVDILAENVMLPLQDKIIIENYLQVLNKGNIIYEGLPHFDEIEKSSQQFINALENFNSNLLERKYLCQKIKELPEKGKLKK